jgi:hypothetical protein
MESIDIRQLNTILAALRWWDVCKQSKVVIPLEIVAIELDSEEGDDVINPLTSDEINELCERLNCSSAIEICPQF